jgi:acyl-coenzyme A synthetase/AMP-(fatty) acid ligase
MVEHCSLVNLCFWHNDYYGVTAADHAARYAAVGFDASVWEIFPYLLKGAAIYLAAEAIKLDIEALNRFYETCDITIAFLPTPVCEQFMSLDNRSLRVLLTGGDRLRIFKERAYRLYNNYGPTETTVVATAYLVESWENNIPIGKPIANTRIYILDRNFNLTPTGITGELHIGGTGIARGCLNNPEQTAERFQTYLSKSFCRGVQGGRFLQKAPPLAAGGKKTYKTGDLGRWLPDGNIQFIGRLDDQVKVRGFRVELAEIEQCLLKHPALSDALVILKTDEQNNRYLSAYVVSVAGISVDELRKHLAGHLPVHMIPPYFTFLEAIPLTPGGKPDRKRLPEPEKKTNVPYAAPGTGMEKTIAGTWAKVLGLDRVGIHDYFFDLGGNSVAIIEVCRQLKEELKRDVPPTAIFLNPTVSRLARHLEGEVVDRTDRGEAIADGRGRLKNRLDRRKNVPQRM